MGLLSNLFNRKAIEMHGKEIRRQLDEVDAILLSRGSESGDPDLEDAEITEQPIRIKARVYDFGKNETQSQDLLHVRKLAYVTYPRVKVNDILLIENEDYTISKVDNSENAGEVLLYLE